MMMANYKVKIPGAVFEVSVDDDADRNVEKKAAIDKAVNRFREELDELIATGDIYRVPEVYKKLDEE